MNDIFTSNKFSFPRNARLKYCGAYTEKNSKCVFLKLIYDYEDTEGLHRIIFPKVSTTIATSYIPIISSEPGFASEPILFFKQTGYPVTDNKFPILKADVHEFDIDNVYFVDKLIKPNTKEMTIEDIEKELGYKVKIVNKKEK